jgi:hypothetical protein
MSNDELRIAVCLVLAAVLVFPSLALMNSNPLFILSLGVGILVIIYAFSPDLASEIVDGIKEIVTAPFKK